MWHKGNLNWLDIWKRWENNQCDREDNLESSSRKHDHPTLKGVSRGHRPWRRAAAMKRCVLDEMPIGKCMCGDVPFFPPVPHPLRCFFWPKDVKVRDTGAWKMPSERFVFSFKEAEQRKEEKIVKKTQIGIVHLCFISIHLWTSIYHKALCSHLILFRGNFLSLKRRHFHPLCNKKFKVSIIMILPVMKNT